MNSVPSDDSNNPTGESIKIEWQSFSRPFTPPQKQVLTTLLLILLLVSIILFFLRQFSLIAALISIYFVYWALKTVQPQKVRYLINKDGIWVGDKLYKWSHLREFWFENQNNYYLFFIRSSQGLSHLIILTVPNEKEIVEKIEKHLRSKLNYNPPQPSFIDKIIKFFNKHFEFNSSSETT